MTSAGTKHIDMKSEIEKRKLHHISPIPLHREARVLQLDLRVLADGSDLLDRLHVIQHGIEGLGDAHSDLGPVPVTPFPPHKVHKTGIHLLQLLDRAATSLQCQLFVKMLDIIEVEDELGRGFESTRVEQRRLRLQMGLASAERTTLLNVPQCLKLARPGRWLAASTLLGIGQMLFLLRVTIRILMEIWELIPRSMQTLRVIMHGVPGAG